MADRSVSPLQFPGMDNRGQRFISPHYRVGITVYPLPDLQDIPFRPKRGMVARRIDWEPSQSEAAVIGFSWNKQMGVPSGQWTAQIKQIHSQQTGLPLLDFDRQEIGDGDWVDIAILRNGIRVPLCRGVVDSVRRQTRSVGGAESIVWVITGRDHGAFFEYPITWNSLWAKTLNELVSGLFTKRIDGKVGGRPDQLFNALIEGTFKGSSRQGTPSGQWILPQALEDIVGGGVEKLFDLIHILTFNAVRGGNGLRGAYYNEPQLWTVGEQPLHQTLSQWVNPLLNEFWYDLIPPPQFLPQNGLHGFLRSSFKDLPRGVLPVSGETDLIFDEDGIHAGTPVGVTSENEKFGTIGAMIRERPFPTSTAGKDSMWFSLPTWKIPTWLIQSSDLGKSGHQRFNLFELLADFGIGPQQEQAAFSKPQWHKADIFTHGLRSYSQSTRFFSESSKIGGWFQERSEWLQILVDWFAPNPYLDQGTITVRALLPEIRIGHRVILDNGDPKQGLQCYVEGVNLQATGPTQSAGVTGTTTLTLTRGFRGTDEELIKATADMAKLYREVF